MQRHHPGTILTQMSEEDMKNNVKRTYLEHRIPLGRVGDAASMAGPAVVSGLRSNEQLRQWLWSAG